MAGLGVLGIRRDSDVQIAAKSGENLHASCRTAQSEFQVVSSIHGGVLKRVLQKSEGTFSGQVSR